jgi:hypothetical protein
MISYVGRLSNSMPYPSIALDNDDTLYIGDKFFENFLQVSS